MISTTYRPGMNIKLAAMAVEYNKKNGIPVKGPDLSTYKTPEPMPKDWVKPKAYLHSGTGFDAQA